MKCSVYENKEDILIVFDDKDNYLDRYGATHISKTTLGAAAGFGFNSFKEIRDYVKKHKLKRCASFQCKQYKRSTTNEGKSKQ